MECLNSLNCCESLAGFSGSDITIQVIEWLLRKLVENCVKSLQYYIFSPAFLFAIRCWLGYFIDWISFHAAAEAMEPDSEEREYVRQVFFKELGLALLLTLLGISDLIVSCCGNKYILCCKRLQPGKDCLCMWICFQRFHPQVGCPCLYVWRILFAIFKLTEFYNMSIVFAWTYNTEESEGTVDSLLAAIFYIYSVINMLMDSICIMGLLSPCFYRCLVYCCRRTSEDIDIVQGPGNCENNKQCMCHFNMDETYRIRIETECNRTHHPQFLSLNGQTVVGDHISNSRNGVSKCCWSCRYFHHFVCGPSCRSCSNVVIEVPSDGPLPEVNFQAPEEDGTNWKYISQKVDQSPRICQGIYYAFKNLP